MSKYFSDYKWKGGMPFGIQPTQDSTESYKIISDPYNKHLSIEKYINNQLVKVIYDSTFLDFRHLKSPFPPSWERSLLLEDSEKQVHLIKNQDDRALFFETTYYQENFCKECHLHSCHGPLISIHKMFYTHFNDPFNGVILFDQNNHQVMKKTYEWDDKLLQFTTLISEDWNS